MIYTKKKRKLKLKIQWFLFTFIFVVSIVLIYTYLNQPKEVEPIIEAGTVIPTDLKTIDNLSPQRDGQESIELPICVGSKNKILYNIKLFWNW